MSDYIKRVDAKLRIFEYGVKHRDDWSIASACENLERQMNAIPAADAVEVVRCRDCKHRVVNENYGKKGFLKIKAMCKLDTGDPFELGRSADIDEWFCADGERNEGK